MKRIFFTLLACWSTFWAHSAQAQQAFRIAQLTDLHVHGDRPALEDLRRSVSDINAQPDIDLVLVSGDITEDGSTADLLRAKSVLDSLRVPYYAIPGNHETKWSESGATAFYTRVWKDSRFSFAHKGYHFLGFNSGPVLRMADGHVPPQDLAWLREQLGRLDKAAPLVVVTHYPLDEGVDNYFEVIDLLRPYNVRFVLCGHGHANKALDYEGLAGVMGRSNLRAKEAVGGYTLIDFGQDSVRFAERRPGVVTLPPWHALVLEGKVGKEGPYKSRPALWEPAQGISLRWRRSLGHAVFSQAVVQADRLWVGDEGGRLHCLSLQDGATLWDFQAGKALFGTPAVAGSRVLCSSADGYLYCLDAQSGALRWKQPFGAEVLGGVAVADGRVYVGGSDGTFRAFRLRDGKPLWTYGGLKGYVETQPTVAEGKVLFGAWDTYLYALDARKGTLCWKWSNGSPVTHYSPAACQPVVAQGRVFVVAPDRAMTALDLQTGAQLWRSKDHKVREAIGRSPDGALVLARCMNDSLMALKAEDCSLAWKQDCGFGYDISPSMPQADARHSYFSTKNGWIISNSLQDGALRWKCKVGNSLVNTLALLPGGRLLATNTDGEVLLLAEQEREQ